MTEHLNERIQQIFKENGISFEAKKMFGGICYMVNDKMCGGVTTDKNTGNLRFIGRVGDTFYQEALTKPHCSAFDITGKPLKGLVFVSMEGVDTQQDLEYWVQKCLDYNPVAKKGRS